MIELFDIVARKYVAGHLDLDPNVTQQLLNVTPIDWPAGFHSGLDELYSLESHPLPVADDVPRPPRIRPGAIWREQLETWNDDHGGDS